MSISRLNQLITLAEAADDIDLLEMLDLLISEDPQGVTEQSADELLTRCLHDRVVSMLSSTIAHDAQTSEIETMSEEDRLFMLNAAKIARTLFTKEGWRFSERNLNPRTRVFEVGYGMPHANFRVRVLLQANPRICEIKALFPLTVNPKYEHLLCWKMATLNYKRRYGAIIYDDESGELAYSYSYPIGHDFDGQELRRLFLTIVTTADNVYEELRRFSLGAFHRSEVEQILGTLNTLLEELSDE